MKTLKKRRNENKTSYKKRLGLLKSGTPRIVIRKTNRYVIVQYIKSHEAQDKVIVHTTSKELLKHGWPESLEGSLKSIPCAYLTGFIAGKKILEKEKNPEIILDAGLHRNIHGNRIYAVLKGLIDAGLKIKADKKSFPKEERISGKHLNQNVQKAFEQLKNKIK